jgi:pyrimidine-nucleoside phosphorylase
VARRTRPEAPGIDYRLAVMASLAPLEILERARRGESAGPDQVRGLVESWLGGGATDAQMAAWCMAVCLNGLSEEATAALTDALVASGDRLDLARLGPTGDKQSTGGVGDATTFIVAPLAAAMGVKVAIMSGRGQGHTGGTIDKLESIPGMATALTVERFVRQARDVGIVVASHSDRLVPGTRRLSALRDATGTTHSRELVAATVMSAKIAGGTGSVVLDIKVGPGAFAESVDAARAAADAMVAAARPWGRSVRWIVSSMDQPLGRHVGNALEVRGAAEVLRGGGASDLRALSLRLAATMAEGAGAVEPGAGMAAAEAKLASGDALRMAERWVEAQGGDPGVWTDIGHLPEAPVRLPVSSPHSGRLARLDAREVGEAARWVGAGRMHEQQSVDPAAGVELVAKVGDEVAEGEPLAWVHGRDEGTAQRAAAMVLAGVTVTDEDVSTPDLILGEGK